MHWSIRKLTLLFYPFAAAAVAINLFLLGLLGQAVGFAALSPSAALLCAIPLGVPASWLCARWIRGLMDEADGNR